MKRILHTKIMTTLLLITLMMNTTSALHSNESTTSTNKDLIINDLNCLGAASFNLDNNYEPVSEVKEEGEEKQEEFGTTATVATLVIAGGLSYITIELLKALTGGIMAGGK